MTIKHTPTPWNLESEVNPDGDETIVMAHGYEWRICDMYYKPDDGMSCDIETAQANAALIVRAVNAHEDLIEALEIAEVIAERSVIDGKAPRGALNTIRAALAKAQGDE